MRQCSRRPTSDSMRAAWLAYAHLALAEGVGRGRHERLRVVLAVEPGLQSCFSLFDRPRSARSMKNKLNRFTHGCREPRVAHFSLFTPQATEFEFKRLELLQSLNPIRLPTQDRKMRPSKRVRQCRAPP